jgi:ATP-dependent DNA helicase RecG
MTKISKLSNSSNFKEQAFVIYPLIDESEKIDYKAAVAEFERLSKSVFRELKVGLLHGRLTNEEKDQILMKFKNKEFNVLVATSVVEVGIDIPDATVMVIEDADRFGLAQLHQFRGRVGRGNMQSYCFVIPGEVIKKTDKAMQRLRYFAQHASGFDVAEFDLKSRGPGEVYGVAQSGIPNFKVADITDFESVINARKAAARMLKEKSTREVNEIVKGLFH